MTTASEGLVEAMEGANTDDVGAVFVIDADPAITGLTPNDGDWTVCNYALQL